MRILFLCTAHNSLSQRLHLELSADHEVTVEYALSPEVMIEAANLVKPHLIICPFLTALVPKAIHTRYLTLIIHPGVPGDGGPSALDWVLMGDDGTEADSDRLLKDESWSTKGRSHWGVTILQAVEEFDAGPVWAFEQFPLDIDDPQITKSSLYRGEITRAAVKACSAAIQRIEISASMSSPILGGFPANSPRIGPHLRAIADYRIASVTTQQIFQGGQTHYRPLLKASQRDFDIKRHSAQVISRRIRASDSQPGCLSTLFKTSLYLYGGIIEDGKHMTTIAANAGTVIGTRNDAVCVKTADGKGIWITHLRRVKKKTDPSLWPKVPALPLLFELGILNRKTVPQRLPPLPAKFLEAGYSTFQEVFVEYETLRTGQRIAYLTFDFYNGATSTSQCYQTSAALRSILASHTESSPLSSVVLMGGAYFSNGIHLGVIEAADDPAFESWANINAIDDIVLQVLQDFSEHGITTISAIRGNAAAGGVALAAAADMVIAGENVVLNPAYRALGLYGSEYHSISYNGRTGRDTGYHLLRDMLPVSPHNARRIGLVDVVLPGYGDDLDQAIRTHVSDVVSSNQKTGQWKRKLDLSRPALAHARMQELGEMSKDFWSARSVRYHSRRHDFVRKIKPTKTPLRFAKHRRQAGELDEEEKDVFDQVERFEKQDTCDSPQELQQTPLLESVEHLRSVAWRAKTLTTLTTSLSDKNLKKLDPIFSCYYNMQ